MKIENHKFHFFLFMRFKFLLFGQNYCNEVASVNNSWELELCLV